MSHSQFHSVKLFILRHAWLNLRNKHMTTGRINQVTVLLVRRATPFKRHALHSSTHTPTSRRGWGGLQGGHLNSITASATSEGKVQIITLDGKFARGVF